MNRVNTIGVLLLLTCIGKSYAQDAPIEKQIAHYNFWTAKLPLFNFLDFNSPNLQLGGERRLDKHNAVQLIGGLSIDPNGKENKNPHSFINGYRFKAEYRRYFHVRTSFAFYVAGDVFYTTYNRFTHDSFISAISSAHYSDNFYLQKKMAGADLKWGFQRMLEQHFMFEFFAGLGFKSKTVTQTHRTAPSDERVPPPRPTYVNFNAMANQLGTYTTPTMPVNFVIGYKFR